MFPAMSPYFSGAAAEPGRLGAPVKTFIQVTKTEGLTDRGYRAVPPLDPALCAVFGVKPGLSDRCPTPKDQLTAKLTDGAHRCMMQQEAVMNNIALLAHNISTMAADFGQYTEGLAVKLYLYKGSLPTLRGIPADEGHLVIFI
ncbi:unnamed protein product [Boreogadus saida]